MTVYRDGQTDTLLTKLADKWQSVVTARLVVSVIDYNGAFSLRS